MVYIAIDDAIIRLTYLKDGSVNSAVDFLDRKDSIPHLVDGLIRAIAILKLIPSREDIERIINYGNRPGISDNNRTWIASASAGWNGNNVEQFLNRCALCDNPQTKRAAEAALKKTILSGTYYIIIGSRGRPLDNPTSPSIKVPLTFCYSTSGGIPTAMSRG